MTNRSDRVHATLLVPGTPNGLEAWRRALRAKGLELTGTGLMGASLPFAVGAEWIDNPGDRSFGKAFSFGTATEAEVRRIDAAPGALLLSVKADLHRERGPIAAMARDLAACGALAVRVEESKVGYPVSRWADLVGEADPWSLYRAVVMVLVDENHATTCGMHVFSLPDAQVTLDAGLDAREANDLLGVLNVFQLAEDPALATGHTFSPSADAPRRVLHRWPDANYPGDHLCHNPFGVWRLGPPGGSGSGSSLAYVFMPALVVLLTAAERKAGRPLTQPEVEQITSGGVCMTMQHRDAQALERKRGYADIDPEQAWAQWQVAREGLGPG